MKRMFVFLVQVATCYTILAMSEPATGQNIEKIKFSELEQRLAQNPENLLVVNFWATWCKPCVAELPHFEALHKKFGGQGVEVLLVSLDLASDLDNRVKPFVAKKKLKSETMLLDDQDYDSWIGKISPEWQGDIPATLFVHKAKGIREFQSKEFKEGELETFVTKLLAQP